MRFSAKWLPQWYSGRDVSGVPGSKLLSTGSALRRPAKLQTYAVYLILSAPDNSY